MFEQAVGQRRVTVGIDLVRIRRIAASLTEFGERFLRRVFTDAEVAHATASPALTAERLAARFAAKEAAMKALGLAERGAGWRQIEVTRQPSGMCRLSLHDAAREAADESGVVDLAVSLSREGDYAVAIVVATRNHREVAHT